MSSRLTDRVDVYALGGIIYYLLTGKHPYSSKNDRGAALSVARGIKPELPSKMSSNSDPAIKFLKRTMEKCLIYDARKRPAARTIADSLKKELKHLRTKE